MAKTKPFKPAVTKSTVVKVKRVPVLINNAKLVIPQNNLSLISPFNAMAIPLLPHALPSYNFTQLNDLLLKQSPNLRAAIKSIDLAQEDLAVSKQRPNPRLSLFTQSGRIASTLGNPQQVGLTQEIETSGKRGKRTFLANLVLEQARLEYQSQVWQTRNLLKQRYIRLAQVEINMVILRGQKSLWDSVLNRPKNVAIPESDVLQARLASHQLDPLLSSAQSLLDQTQSDVNVLLGNQLPRDFWVVPLELAPDANPISGLAPLRLPSSLKVPPLFEAALAQRLDYRSLQFQLAQAGQLVTLQQAEQTPNVEVTAGYQAAFNAPDPFTNNSRKLIQGPYAGISMPLLVWHQFKPQIAKAKIVQEQTRLQVKALELIIHSDIEKAVSRLIAAEQIWQQYDEELLPDTTDMIRLAQKNYRSGQTGLVNLIVSQQTAEQIYQSFLDAIVEYQQAWLALEMAVGHAL